MLDIAQRIRSGCPKCPIKKAFNQYVLLAAIVYRSDTWTLINKMKQKHQTA